ncbi:hypothetical protein [Carboxydothermus pertinax]|uniref:Uncharacterized protein n=1 Tax=Carboxydothermus pertinax TaxID=870242 RepID=A0A1L8CV96_9THEO|nr:hypothetical protein [Carboxydothermus pertinax]GAV22875.1 hypothetical protein cpu_13850 [Carboxydothermus pertinax]
MCEEGEDLARLPKNAGENLEEASKYLGVFTVKLLVERVIYDLSGEMPEIEILECDEAGFNFEKIRKFIKDNPEFNLGQNGPDFWAF